MGAENFITAGRGKTVDVAFGNAVAEAQYESGHGGYTGTIAEKHDFTVIEVPDGVRPHDFAEQLMEAGDERIDDKWGPAGAVRIDDDHWLFFGWASS